MSLMDKLAQKLALRWLRGRIERARKEGNAVGKVLKFLDGWKLAIAFVVLAGLKWWDALHNGHAGDMAGAILAMLGWTPPEWTVHSAAEAAAYGIALWGIVHKLYKAQQQARAGATPAELLSEPGYVKAAIAKGDILAGDSGPVLKG